MQGSYLSTWGVRSDPCACLSGGEPFDLHLPSTSLPRSPLMAPEPLFNGVAMSHSTEIYQRKKKIWKHGSWCKIRRTYIASTATYSKTDEYIRTINFFLSKKGLPLPIFITENHHNSQEVQHNSSLTRRTKSYQIEIATSQEANKGQTSALEPNISQPTTQSTS